MEDKSYYKTIECSIKNEVDDSVKSFEHLSPKMKIRQIETLLRDYLNASNSANYYAQREKKNDVFAVQRVEWEYREQLSTTKIRSLINILSREDLELYVGMLQKYFDSAMAEKDIKKKFQKYDFVLAGCQLCSIQEVDILSKINEIKNNCKNIIEDIRTM